MDSNMTSFETGQPGRTLRPTSDSFIRVRILELDCFTGTRNGSQSAKDS